MQAARRYAVGPASASLAARWRVLAVLTSVEVVIGNLYCGARHWRAWVTLVADERRTASLALAVGLYLPFIQAKFGMTLSAVQACAVVPRRVS